MVDRYSSSSNTYSSNYPSFSSTLLDAIYRSIDSTHEVELETDPLRTMKQQKKKNKKVSEEDKSIRESNPPLLKVKTNNTNRAPAGSDPVQRPRPVRLEHCPGFSKTCGEPKQKPKQESGFLKTKSRALKMYGDLKKAKQPISPGKKLAGFLNSLFSNNGNSDLKKRSSKVVNPKDDYTPSMKSTVTTTTSSSSTCSSTSSFSRSCLSKTPSSSRKSAINGGVKRSVKFSSVSMIIDETDYKQTPSVAEEDNVSRINDEIMVRVMEKNRRVEEAAVDFLRNYQKSSSHVEDSDDCASYASSDLFELDNLSSIGLMERVYADDELPVYETTHLQNDRAFANGTMMVV